MNCRCSPIQYGNYGGNSTAPNGIMGVGLGSVSLLAQAEANQALSASLAYCLEKEFFLRPRKCTWAA